MNKRRILVLVHTDLVPPTDLSSKDFDRDKVPWVTEYDVITHLKKLGHTVETLGIYSDLLPIRKAVEEFKPHIVFNLLEEFDGEALFDQNVVSYLELLRVPYTGCNPRGLILARDKALSKKILNYHRIPTARFAVFPKSKKKKLPKEMKYPLIVKCLSEEASLGISKASIVHNEQKLYERVEFINRKIGVDAIVEEFIEGLEYYVGVLGNYRLQSLPVWQLQIENSDNPEREIYTEGAKFNSEYRKKWGIGSGPANLSPELTKRITELCKKTYKVLGLNGYARIDLRITKDETIYVLEANPNPDISFADEFALSARKNSIAYPELLERILKYGKSWFGDFPQTP